MAKPNNFDGFCWFVVTNYDFVILKKLNLTAPFKKNTFYCTLNLTQFSNFTVTLTLSCYQTWWDGLDLTCSSSRGLNFDDFPFFYFLERTSGSQVMPNLRLVKNWEICSKIVIIIIGIMQYTVVHWTSFSFLAALAALCPPSWLTDRWLWILSLPDQTKPYQTILNHTKPWNFRILTKFSDFGPKF